MDSKRKIILKMDALRNSKTDYLQCKKGNCCYMVKKKLGKFI